MSQQLVMTASAKDALISAAGVLAKSIDSIVVYEEAQAASSVNVQAPAFQPPKALEQLTLDGLPFSQSEYEALVLQLEEATRTQNRIGILGQRGAMVLEMAAKLVKLFL